MNANTDAAKQTARMRVWDLLEREAVVEAGVHGHIPDFTGADAAAERLTTTPAWRDASVIKAVPDRAQQPVRACALRDGKLLYMAVPGLAEDPPFYLLDPVGLSLSSDEAASKEGAARAGRKVSVGQMLPVDLVICGSVAVNRSGARLGKGAGYSDIEVALLHEAGLFRPQTVIATTVHPLQVVSEALPETTHDFSVDLIVTPDDVIECGPSRRPTGLYWDDLPEGKIAAIPVLASRRSQHSGRIE